MLRDKIMYSKHLQCLNLKCYACNSISHFITHCDQIHLILNKDIRIKKLNYSKPILERKSIIRAKRKSPCALLTMQKFNRTISEIESNESEEEEGGSYGMNSFSTYEFERKGNMLVRKSKLGSFQIFPTVIKEISDTDIKQVKQEEEAISERHEKKENKEGNLTKNMTIISNSSVYDKKSEGKKRNTIQTKIAQLVQNLFDFDFDALKNYKHYFSKQNCFQIVERIQKKRKGNETKKRKRRKNIMELEDNNNYQ